jgi:hypothetical protein
MINRTKTLLGVLIGLVALAAALPCGVAAKGTPNVAGGLHNLSASGTDPFGGPSMYRTDETEICVFCHTPHGGSLTGPLWNRNNPTTSWTHYTSSTLGTYLAGLSNSRAISDESLLCMSCHDGSISVNHVINLPNTRTTPIKDAFGDPDTTIGLGFIVGARIGGSPGNEMGTGDLTDDHPISFSYDDVLASGDYVGAGAKVGQLRDVPTASTWASEGVRFFNRPMAGLGGNRVECSTCHDPHVEYDAVSNTAHAPFLIMSNAGSNLCLACHNK